MKAVYVVGAVAVVAAVAFVAYKKAGGAAGVASSVGGAVVDAADGVVSGAVFRLGDLIGVPRTDLTECERAKLNGDTWEASFACPAADFLKYVFN